MQGRISWDGRYLAMNIDWISLVESPSKNGYFIEAFSAADAIIDSQLQSILRQVYGSQESQHLISQLESVKEETRFFGTGILEILEKIGVIKKDPLGKKIRWFKGQRNKVCHSIHGEYALERPTQYKTQEEYDLAIEKLAKKNLSKGLDIFMGLIDIGIKLSTKLRNMDKNEKARWIIQKEKDF